MGASSRIQAVDTGDELPPVCQIDVVTTGVDGRGGYRVLLCLKRSRGMNERVHTRFLQPGGQIRIIGVQRDGREAGNFRRAANAPALARSRPAMSRRIERSEDSDSEIRAPNPNPPNTMTVCIQRVVY